MIHVEFSCWMLANSYKMKAQYKGNEKKGRMDKRRRSRHFRGHEHASFLEKVLNIFLPSAVLPSFSRPVLAPFYNFCFSKVIFHCHGVWRPQGNLEHAAVAQEWYFPVQCPMETLPAICCSFRKHKRQRSWAK